MRSQNQTITLCWALWLPFDGDGNDERETIVELNGGSQGFPNHRLVYTENVPQPSDEKVCYRSVCFLCLKDLFP